mmetsp:Transcript_95235/g.188708  ORF Transcript_95235/g.188708 Transcript_95235/m.188708 type:complete len:681 (-) Transcript_95235:161-2203(-)
MAHNREAVRLIFQQLDPSKCGRVPRHVLEHILCHSLKFDAGAILDRFTCNASDDIAYLELIDWVYGDAMNTSVGKLPVEVATGKCYLQHERRPCQPHPRLPRPGRRSLLADALHESGFMLPKNAVAEALHESGLMLPTHAVALPEWLDMELFSTVTVAGKKALRAEPERARSREQSVEFSDLRSLNQPQALRGITVAHLKAFLVSHVQPKQAELGKRLTTREVVKELVIPLTAESKCQFTGLLPELFPQIEMPLTGHVVDYFVTHSWDHIFEEIVRELWMHFDDKDAVWFCALCLNQHRIEEELSHREVFAGALLAETTKAQILMLDSSMTVMKRLWVVFEIMRNLNANRDMIILPKHVLHDGAEAVSRLRIQLEHVQCYDPGDRDYILGELQKMPGAQRGINDKIRAAIQSAMLQDLLQSLGNTARVFQRHGRLADAEELFRDALRKSELGISQDVTARGCRKMRPKLIADLMGILYRKHDYDEVLRITNGLVDVPLTSDDAGLLTAVNVLGLTLAFLGRQGPSEKLFAALDSILHGTRDEWLVSGNLACVKQLNGELDKAIALSRAAWEKGAHMDSHHPDRLTAKNNAVVTMTHISVAYPELISDVLEDFRALCSVAERDRLSTSNVLSIAASLLHEVESGWVATLGEDHTSLQAIRRNLATLTRLAEQHPSRCCMDR